MQARKSFPDQGAANSLSLPDGQDERRECDMADKLILDDRNKRQRTALPQRLDNRGFLAAAVRGCRKRGFCNLANRMAIISVFAANLKSRGSSAFSLLPARMELSLLGRVQPRANQFGDGVGPGCLGTEGKRG